MGQFSFRLPAALHNRLAEVAAQSSVSRASIIREALENHLTGLGDLPVVHRDRPEELWRILVPLPSVQVVGEIGVGKTTLVRNMILSHGEVVWVVIDSHDEYTNLPKREVVAPKPRSSYRIVPPKAKAAAQGIFPLYVNQILSRRWPTSMILVVEEAHRYADLVAGLLAECRKFVKVLTVSPSRLVDYVPAVKVISKAR